MVEIISDSMVTARKEHTCSFCGLPIKNKAKYNRAVIKESGNIYVWKSHKSCMDLAQNIEDCDDGVSQYEFNAFVCNCIEEQECSRCPYKENNEECHNYSCFEYCLPFVKNYFNT